jgi:signal transduction histidine kinase
MARTVMLQRFMQFLHIDRAFLGAVFVFAYIFVISVRLTSGQWSWYVFTPEGPLAQFIQALLIFTLLRLLLNRFATSARKSYVKAGIAALLVYLAAANALSLLIALSFGTVERNFNSYTLLLNNVNLVVQFVLFGGLYLAYSYAQDLNHERTQLANYRQQVAELQLQQLKQQLNPHFVFNALNVLDELIYADTQRASDYLNAFAELYRAVLEASGERLVSLAHELNFASNYFKLMQVRYGEGYTLQAQGEPSAQHYLPPYSLQVLIENALQHNQASATQPVVITITISDADVTVHNNRHPRQHAKPSHQVGLTSLTKQFAVLTQQPLEIRSTATEFSVRMPLLTTKVTQP